MTAGRNAHTQRIVVITPDLIVMPCTFARPPLLENSRMIWQEKARHTKVIRHEAHVKAKALMQAAQTAGWVLPIDYPIDVVLYWSVKTVRNRDAPGPSPTIKAWIDGMTTGNTAHPGAGLIKDDYNNTIPNHRCVIEDHSEQPGCRVEITRR